MVYKISYREIDETGQEFQETWQEMFWGVVPKAQHPMTVGHCFQQLGSLLAPSGGASTLVGRWGLDLASSLEKKFGARSPNKGESLGSSGTIRGNN